MQKCAEQNTNIRSKVLLYQLLEFHALGDHQTESCLREVISYKRFKFKKGWRDASSDWLPRRTCFRGGFALLVQISCFRERHFELSRYRVFQLNIGCSEMVCLCMHLPFSLAHHQFFFQPAQISAKIETVACTQTPTTAQDSSSVTSAKHTARSALHPSFSGQIQ